MINTALTWIDDRTGYREFLNRLLDITVPRADRWRHLWGSTLVFTFLIQVITGFVLWAAYSPGTRTAWESVYYIQHEMTAGFLVRGLHHFASDAMVVLMAIHFIKVVISGAYRAPRELNFWVLIGLIHLVLGIALTGYLLPWDQFGYYGNEIRTSIMGSAPLVGEPMKTVVLGGPTTGHHTLTRMMALHAGLLPALLVGLFIVYVYCGRRATLRQESHAGQDSVRLFPDQLLRIAIACCVVLAVILALSIFKQAPLTAPVDPSTKFDAARPEWYFLFLFQFLHFEVISGLGIPIGAIVIPGIFVSIVAAMPMIAAVAGRIGHAFNVSYLFVMLAVMFGLSALALYNDTQDEKYLAAAAEADRDSARVIELAQGPERIPPSGALSLMQDDPFTRGPRLFAQHCSSCHRWNGHDGRGNLLKSDGIVLKPTAADLGNFASRDWMRSVLVDYPEHFRFFRNADWYPDEQNESDAEVIDLNTSEMSDWSGDVDSLTSDENKQNLDAAVEWLVSETGHNQLDPPLDVDLVSRGRLVVVEGKWAGTIEGTSCADCHTTIGKPFQAIPEEEADGYPTMAKYGSSAWLKDFIRNPGAARHYGSKNRMPAYSTDQLSDTDLDLLVRYMTGDFLPSRVAEYPDLTAELLDGMQQPKTRSRE